MNSYLRYHSTSRMEAWGEDVEGLDLTAARVGRPRKAAGNQINGGNISRRMDQGGCINTGYINKKMDTGRGG
jgi:hypothetical protein